MLCADKQETKVEKPGDNKPENGANVSDRDHGTYDGDDVKFYVVKSRRRVSSLVEGMIGAAAFGVSPYLDLVGALELLHNNYRRMKKPTLVVEDGWRVA